MYYLCTPRSASRFQHGILSHPWRAYGTGLNLGARIAPVIIVNLLPYVRFLCTPRSQIDFKHRHYPSPWCGCATSLNFFGGVLKHDQWPRHLHKAEWRPLGGAGTYAFSTLLSCFVSVALVRNANFVSDKPVVTFANTALLPHAN